jgi:serine/threonine-protein kinase RsbW
MFSATFSAELRSLQEIREFLRKSVHAAQFSEDDLNLLDLVIEEIAVNVCRYAYSAVSPTTGDRPLRIECGVQGPGDIAVCVADSGLPFDPRTKLTADPRADVKNRPAGGLGIFLAAHFARDILYQRSDGWNRLSFRFSAKPGLT